MGKDLSPKERKRLERKMMETFEDEMNNLPEGLQQALADDLVTAFQNRLAVFLRIKSKTSLLTPNKTKQHIVRIHK